MFSPKSSLLLVTLFVTTLLDIVQTAKISDTHSSNVGQALPLTGKSVVAAADSKGISVQNYQDVTYIVDIVLGGQPLTVSIDTGSADLWVLPPNGPSSLKLTKTTEVAVTQSYDIGDVKGTAQFAELEFAGFTIPSQAFLLATSTQDIYDIVNHVCDGMMGLSFLTLSWVNYELQSAPSTTPASSTAGANPIYNILAQNPSASTFFDMQLHRATDLAEAPSGSLIVGTHMSGFESVDAQPHLPLAVPGRWGVVLDQMSVNGKAFAFRKSVVPGLASGKIAAVIDSGYTYPPIPSAAVDFIYSSIPGSVFFTRGGNWIVPCNETTDVTFTFGGVDFPMHYLDITSVFFAVLTVNDQPMNLTYCSNTFTRNQAAAIDSVDANLGDPFMRNAYVSFNFNGLTTDGENSFMQMVPTTNFSAALPDFQASRAKTLASLPPELPPADFLAALQGQSVSPSDLITAHTFNAPPATAVTPSIPASSSSAVTMAAGSGPSTAATVNVTASINVPTASSSSSSPTSIGGDSTKTSSARGGASLRSVFQLCVPLIIGLLSASVEW